MSSNEGSEIESMDLETLRRRLKELSETRSSPLDSYESSNFEKLLEDWNTNFQGTFKQIESEEPNCFNLGPEDLVAYTEQLKKEISLVENENMKNSSEIYTLASAITEESAVIDGDLERLAYSLEFTDPQGQPYMPAVVQNDRSIVGERRESAMHALNHEKYEIWKLDQQIEKSKFCFSNLEELNYAFKSLETIEEMEDMLSEAKVIEAEGNFIRLSLKTPLSMSDSLLLRHKLDCFIEPHILDHELLIEVVDNDIKLKNAKIFPGDVSLDGIVDTFKSLSQFIPTIRSSLGWFVTQVQHRIILCALRRLLVKDANKSRHYFEYSDKDDTITAHLVGGIDAFIKISPGWPLSTCVLKLLSVKGSDAHSRSISLSFLCKVKEVANSLDAQIRHNLVCFVDAIEEILIEAVRSEPYS